MADTQADTQPAIKVQLLGRIVLQGNILLKTGLHIGGASATLSIGGVDNQVIRDPLSGQPYIPGSSLRGKLRSLSEKFTGRKQNFAIGQGVSIHVCKTKEDYAQCEVCQIFGVPGEMGDPDKDGKRTHVANAPTRLLVRDVFLTEDSAKALQELRTDLPYTEIKWEAAIDRVTSAATPRQMERVPAGAVFGPFTLIYSLYDEGDIGHFNNVLRALRLLEDDFLGGQGARGSGQIAFQDLKLWVKGRNLYDKIGADPKADCPGTDLNDLLTRLAGKNLGTLLQNGA